MGDPSHFLMGEARPGNRRGALHGGTERESRGTGLGAMGWWVKGGGGMRGGPEASAFFLLCETVTCWVG